MPNVRNAAILVDPSLRFPQSQPDRVSPGCLAGGSCFASGPLYRTAPFSSPDTWAGRWPGLFMPRGFVDFGKQMSWIPMDWRCVGFQFGAREGSHAHRELRDAFAQLGRDGLSARMILDVLQDGLHAEKLATIVTLIKYRLIDLRRSINVNLPSGVGRGTDGGDRASFLHKLSLEGANPPREHECAHLVRPDPKSLLSERFQMLADVQVNLDLQDDRGLRPLHYAVLRDNAAAAAALIFAGANLDVASHDGITPVLLAVKLGANESLAELLRAGADTTRTFPGERKMPGLKFERRFFDGAWRMYVAVTSSNRPQAAKDWTVLHWAASQRGSAAGDSVRILAELGADPNALSVDGDTPLHIACRAGGRGKVAPLLMAGADASIRSGAGYTPLELACMWGKSKVVAELLRGGVPADLPMNPDAPPEEQLCPIDLALKYGCEEAAIAMVELGVKVTPDRMGAAAREGFIKLLKCMVRHGAKLDCRNRAGWSLVHYAAMARKPDVLRWLVKQRVYIDSEYILDGVCGPVGVRGIHLAEHLEVYNEFLRLGAEFGEWRNRPREHPGG